MPPEPGRTSPRTRRLHPAEMDGEQQDQEQPAQKPRDGDADLRDIIAR